MEQRVILYGKPECCLCDLTHQLLMGLQREFKFTIEKVDITRDPALLQQYRDKIPVVVIGDHTFAAPIHLMDLRTALKHSAPDQGHD